MIQIIFAALAILILYFIKNRFGDYFKDYMNNTLKHWPKFPSWINWVLAFFLFVACTYFFLIDFYSSVIVWFGILLFMPFILSINPQNKYLNRIGVVSFLVSLFFTVVLIGNLDRTRDFIGNTFISNYKLEYKTVTKYSTSSDGAPEKWSEDVPFFHTGDHKKDYFLKNIFPIIYYYVIGFLWLISLSVNVFIKKSSLGNT